MPGLLRATSQYPTGQRGGHKPPKGLHNSPLPLRHRDMREIDMLNRRQRSGGFSLIKLLIAIAIAIILIIIMIAVPTIAVPRYGNTQKYMRETAAVAAIQTIHKV